MLGLYDPQVKGILLGVMEALFVELPTFERHRAEYLADDEFRKFQQMLLKNPVGGDVTQHKWGCARYDLGMQGVTRRSAAASEWFTTGIGKIPLSVVHLVWQRSERGFNESTVRYFSLSYTLIYLSWSNSKPISSRSSLISIFFEWVTAFLNTIISENLALLFFINSSSGTFNLLSSHSNLPGKMQFTNVLYLHLSSKITLPYVSNLESKVKQ